MLYQIKSKKKLISSLFNEEKLSLLIFHQVKLKKELILHRYFAGKLKICFIKTCRKQYYFLTYLVKGTSQVREIGRTHCFLLIYCKEIQKINSLPSQIMLLI